MSRTVGQVRAIVPGIDLQFASTAARYDPDRDAVIFLGRAGSETIPCAISREALEDHFDADDLKAEGRLHRFQRNRSEIEAMARSRYLHDPVEESPGVLIRTSDVPGLRRSLRRKKT